MYHRDVDIRQRDLTTAAASFTCHQSRHRFVCLSSDYHVSVTRGLVNIVISSHPIFRSLR